MRLVGATDAALGTVTRLVSPNCVPLALDGEGVLMSFGMPADCVGVTSECEPTREGTGRGAGDGTVTCAVGADAPELVLLATPGAGAVGEEVREDRAGAPTGAGVLVLARLTLGRPGAAGPPALDSTCRACCSSLSRDAFVPLAC